MLHSTTLGSGSHLVFLHGWGMNSAVWENIANILAKDFTITLIDLPGHGYSQFSDNYKHINTWAELCLETAPPQATWIGWSLGGAVALAAALMYPQQIYNLVLLTSTPCFLYHEHWPHGMRGETLNTFKNTLQTNWLETVGHFLTLQIRGSNNALATLRSLHQCLATYPPPNPAALDAGLSILKHTDLSTQIFALQPPSLWIYGNKDTIVSWRNAETIAKLLPAAQIEIIDGAAHAPFLSHPNQVLALLRIHTQIGFHT